MIQEDNKNEMSIPNSDNFVTVVAVGTSEQELNKDNINFDSNSPGYVTVLTIGDTENNKVLKDVTEEVIVYRLPGERLGFGLKFEGGTKASEFVKRLFIQSCAADSPASRVKSSWGKLAEGDEVVEIDSIPVNTMTRIDCVRCLKDSNVAIKLLVRHIYDQTPKPKLEETLHPVMDLDGRRSPPPPPPVPPRKTPRKLLKNINAHAPREPPDNTIIENCVPATRQTDTHKPKKLQSPRNSIGPYSSPDVSRRDRRFSDGSLGPPDAEVYVDLFLQESTQSLSESDDTGSTISTVIDRFGSFPTTTTSSFSGSLPSTPTSIQRQLDISNINIYDDEEYLIPTKSFNKLSIPPKEENNNIILDEANPLCFQDAPLSYGNESTKIIIPEDDYVNEDPILREESKQFMKKPPVPPRSRDTTLSTEKIDEKRNNENLPRLVDFVPKSCNGIKENNETSAEIMKLFLENERYKADFPDYDAHETDNLDTYTNGIDLYSSKWSLSSQLATIGEVEEEGSSDFSFTRPVATSPPVVVVENTDSNEENEKVLSTDAVDESEPDGIMAAGPTAHRQPPDGHEFPDFIEHHSNSSKQNYFKETESSPTVFSEKVPETPQKKTTESFSNPSNLVLRQSVSSSNTDLRSIMYDSIEDLKHESIPAPAPLHTRSQSLIDMSALTKQKNARWNQLFEQRRKGLSKLKGLVIPEAPETDVTPCVNIPEIKSQNTQILPTVPKSYSNFNMSELLPRNRTESVKSSIAILPWSSNSTSNLPKYSPAFKRKSLQVYTTSFSKDENSECLTNQEFPRYCDKPSSKISKLNDDDLNPPKSLESISSPTRSDCSFDYVSSSRKYVRDSNESLQKSHTNKLEDESDNDSAVSSCQSSYNSRYSPPPSPTRTCEINSYGKKLDDDEKNAQNRLLKPSSVEAINRKNILASAKCRSGKDLKIGSPVIRRKQEETSERTNGDGLKNEKALETVENETRVWESGPPVVNEEIATEKEEVAIKEEVKTKEVEKLVPLPTNVVKNSPLKPLPRSTSLSTLSPPLNFTKRALEDTKENRGSRNFYSSHRKSAPINVKALMENFENFGSSPPPMPQKVPVYKPQKPTRHVKLEIIKREDEVVPKNSKDELFNESGKVDVAPSRVMKPRRLSLDKTEKVVDKKSKAKSTTIVLKSEFVGSSLGITLSGGTDENKEITVHRIRYGSIAYHDGRLKRGDKIISVNGNLTKGLTHSEAVELLKEPVTEFSLVIEEGTEVVPSPTIGSTLQKRSYSMSVLTDIRPPSVEVTEKKANHTIIITKDGSGLGFSIEGGKDSPLGDVPLVVKKIFTGGPADKSGQLKVGDEILQINDMKFTNLSRIEAWNSMKKIEDGQVIIHIYR